MDERRFSYPLELGIAMFNGDGALKPDAYQALYMQAVEPHLANIEMDEPRLILADAAHAYIRPASAAVLAAERTDQAVNADSLRPCYLRAPQAVRQRNLVEKAQHE